MNSQDRIRCPNCQAENLAYAIKCSNCNTIFDGRAGNTVRLAKPVTTRLVVSRTCCKLLRSLPPFFYQPRSRNVVVAVWACG